MASRHEPQHAMLHAELFDFHIREAARCDNESWRKPIMFWVLLMPEDVKKVSWTTGNVQGNACLGTSFLAFSIEPSAHPVSVSYAWR